MTTSLQDISQKYSNIEVQLNRLLAQKASLQHKLKVKNKAERKARTRTLIQLGGILSLTPILEICNIHLGDDLQLSHQDKADTLLGILSTLFESFSDKVDSADMQRCQNIGNALRIAHITHGEQNGFRK